MADGAKMAISSVIDTHAHAHTHGYGVSLRISCLFAPQLKFADKDREKYVR